MMSTLILFWPYSAVLCHPIVPYASVCSAVLRRAIVSAYRAILFRPMLLWYYGTIDRIWENLQLFYKRCYCLWSESHIFTANIIMKVIYETNFVILVDALLT